jgi:hypothetical protein
MRDVCIGNVAGKLRAERIADGIQPRAEGETESIGGLEIVLGVKGAHGAPAVPGGVTVATRARGSSVVGARPACDREILRRERAMAQVGPEDHPVRARQRRVGDVELHACSRTTAGELTQLGIAESGGKRERPHGVGSP